jgi:hypothetical protein
MSDEGIGHRIWGWIGREFGAPAPDPDDPRDMVPILEAAPTAQVEVLAAKLVLSDVAAFVSSCGASGQVIVPWPTDILRTNWMPYAQNRSRSNLYVFRGQLSEAQTLISDESPSGDVQVDQVP